MRVGEPHSRPARGSALSAPDGGTLRTPGPAERSWWGLGGVGRMGPDEERQAEESSHVEFILPL